MRAAVTQTNTHIVEEESPTGLQCDNQKHAMAPFKCSMVLSVSFACATGTDNSTFWCEGLKPILKVHQMPCYLTESP